MSSNSRVIHKSIMWSGLGEICAKLIVPVSTMILARILDPADFGVVAICNMLILFADIITDAGFGKYIVQADFANNEELERTSDVAFWSHLFFSISIWLLIVYFRAEIAIFLGDIQYSDVITIACSQLIIMSLISTQMGLLRRSFNFKKLFVVRVISVFVPLVVTVPLALFLRTYWALIIGNICSYLVSALSLFFLCTWKPRFFFSWQVFKKMFSFSFWSLCEGMAHWLIFWVDTFIIAQTFSSYYVGLYKNSSAMVVSFIGMFTASMSPVLLSTLSRMKNDKELYTIFLHVEKLVMYILFPIAVAVTFYRSFITDVLFGDKWSEAANIIGLWTIMMVVSVVIYSFPAEAFKSQGKPKHLFIYQMFYLIFLVPICYYFSHQGFWSFVYARTGCVMVQLCLFFIFLKYSLHWSILSFLFNLVKPSMLAVSVVFICYFIHDNSFDFYESLLSLFLIFILVIGVVTLCFRKDILFSFHLISNKRINK